MKIKQQTEIKKDEYRRKMQEIKRVIGIETIESIKLIDEHVKRKTNFYKNISSQINLDSIIKYATGIKQLFYKIEEVQSKNHSTSNVHGVQHIKNVLLLSNYLGIVNKVSDENLKIIREAAIYHDVCHEKAGDPSHAKIGARWYLENVNSKLNKKWLLIS